MRAVRAQRVERGAVAAARLGDERARRRCGTRRGAPRPPAPGRSPPARAISDAAVDAAAPARACTGSRRSPGCRSSIGSLRLCSASIMYASGGHRPAAVLEQLEHDQEELVRPDRPDGEVVVAVLGVVEVEPAEAADHREPRHDLLDVRVRQVVAEVDEALAPARPAACASSSDEPQSAFDGRVERGLVRLVLGEEQPAVGQRVVDPAQAVGDALELAAGSSPAPDGSCRRRARR